MDSHVHNDSLPSAPSRADDQQRILIADDEPVIAGTLACIFHAAGYDALSTRSGDEAISAAPAFKPDVFITDYAMPRVNGIEAATAVQKMFPACRVFLLTGYGDTMDFTPHAREPKWRVIAKPIAPNDLLSMVKGPREEPSARSVSILHVEDYEANRYSIKRYLTRFGFRVVGAANGRDALAQADALRPDVILLDINLPDIDGFELCRRFRQVPGFASVVVIHHSATCRDPEARQRSRDAGADEYIEQPVAPEYLVARIRQLLQRVYLHN